MHAKPAMVRVLPAGNRHRGLGDRQRSSPELPWPLSAKKRTDVSKHFAPTAICSRRTATIQRLFRNTWRRGISCLSPKHNGKLRLGYLARSVMRTTGAVITSRAVTIFLSQCTAQTPLAIHFSICDWDNASLNSEILIALLMNLRVRIWAVAPTCSMGATSTSRSSSLVWLRHAKIGRITTNKAVNPSGGSGGF